MANKPRIKNATTIRTIFGSLNKQSKMLTFDAKLETLSLQQPEGAEFYIQMFEQTLKYLF